MKVEVSKRIVVELEEKDVEDLIKKEVFNRTGIDVTEGSIYWGPSGSGNPFAWVVIKESLDK